ncbi:MAG: RNA pseudouridine synthase, partial [Parcubacteria group bacterium]|nr:RNA pseudouridine synthase [Parcubacteria group bacterium]
VHPSVNEPSGTIANALIAKYPELIGVGDPSTSPSAMSSGPNGSGQENLRPGIIHRLDKDTSGLLVVAKNQKTFEFLKKEWQEGRVVKKYLALVWGSPKKEKGEIISELARSLKDFRKRMVVNPKKNKPRRPKEVGTPTEASEEIQGKLAITEYKVIKKFKDYSLLEVYPKTGRTHQIRIHLASLGHQIVGDKVYGKRKETPEGLNRQFLHAYYLSFSLPAQAGLPNGKKMAFEADLPESLKEVLAKIEK